jgi:hypothetical protein
MEMKQNKKKNKTLDRVGVIIQCNILEPFPCLASVHSSHCTQMFAISFFKWMIWAGFSKAYRFPCSFSNFIRDGNGTQPPLPVPSAEAISHRGHGNTFSYQECHLLCRELRFIGVK